MNSEFTDLRQHRYLLHAAFFHRGTQGSGHYWVYIFDFKQEIWRKYNDGYVSKVEDTTEIFGRPSEAEFKSWGGPANPYFLVYVKAGEENSLVECVHRDIIPPPPATGPVTSQMTELPPGRGNMDHEMSDPGMRNGGRSERPPLYFPGKPLVPKEGDWVSGDLTDYLPGTVW